MASGVLWNLLNKTYARSANTGRGPSPAIWGDLPKDGEDVCLVDDDFASLAGTVTTNVGTYSGGYKSFEDTSCSLKNNSQVGGVARALTDATDNNEVSFEAGGGNGGAFKLTAGTGPKLWFECRFTANQIVTQNIYLGLAEVGRAVTDGVFSDSDALADKTLLGFRVLAAASATLKTCQQLNGGGGERTAVAASTLVAGTYIKVGFVYDRNERNGTYLKWFVNGTVVDSATSDTVASFPTAIVMTPYFCIKNSAAAISSLDIDWFACAQMNA